MQLNICASEFDPAALACPAGTDTLACLTPTEVTAVKTLQSDLVLNNQVIGAPYGLGNLVSGLSAVFGGGQVLGQGFLAMAFNSPTFMISNFDLQRDFGFLSKQFGKVDDMTGPLQGVAKYVSEGGKLIVWTGGEDPLVPTADSVRFVERLRDVVDDRGSDNVRLYTLPGVNHCGGGPGADTLDLLTPITNWVEKGVPPKKLTATGTVAFTRPLCPFPQWPKYTGGNTNSASSLTMTTSARGWCDSYDEAEAHLVRLGLISGHVRDTSSNGHDQRMSASVVAPPRNQALIAVSVNEPASRRAFSCAWDRRVNDSIWLRQGRPTANAIIAGGRAPARCEKMFWLAIPFHRNHESALSVLF